MLFHSCSYRENIKIKNSAITIVGQNTALGGEVTGATIRAALPDASITNAQLTNSSISGVALGGTLNTLTMHTDGALEFVSGSDYTGTTARELRIKGASVTNAMLAGSIANDKLANSSISIAGSNINLGESISAATIANTLPSASISNSQLIKNSITITPTG